MDDSRPLARFQQVAKVIRDKISDGSYPIGSRLPSIAALGADFRVSHMTVKQALATLVDEAKQSGVVQKAIDAKGLKGVNVAAR